MWTTLMVTSFFSLLNILLPFNLILAIIKCPITYELIPWWNLLSELNNFVAEMGYQELDIYALLHG